MNGPDLRETWSLVEAAKEGDGEARNALIGRYYPVVVRIAELRLGRPLRGDQDVEDLVQETMLDAFQGLDGFQMRGEGGFRNWLARIVENNIRDRARREHAIKRGKDQVRLYADLGATSLTESVLAGNEATPSEHARGAELERRLERALMTHLGAQYREVIILRDLCGMTHEEIAKELGYEKESTVRSLYTRAREKLEAFL